MNVQVYCPKFSTHVFIKVAGTKPKLRTSEQCPRYPGCQRKKKGEKSCMQEAGAVPLPGFGDDKAEHLSDRTN